MIHDTIHSLFEDLENITASQPNKIALLDNHGRTLTYLQLLNHISGKHAELLSLGIAPNETIIALMPNAIETVILFLASLRGGYHYAPLPCTSTLSEINRLKKITHAHFCFLAHPVSATLQNHIKQMDWQVQIVNIGETIHSPPHAYIKTVSNGRLVMQTSGSTNIPKVMLLDANRLWSAGRAFLNYHRIKNADVRFWNYLPMSYLGGLFNLTLIPLAAGGSIFVDEAFNGKTFLVFWSTIQRFKINSLWLVPTILRGLLTLAEHVGQGALPTAIQYCYLGTAPISFAEKEKFFQVFGIQPLENYGLSETTFLSSETLHEITNRKEGTVGAIMPHVTIKCTPSVNDSMPVTEIWARTPYAMLGYLEENDRIVSATDSEGFFPTGDYGQLLDGQLQLLGRHRDIIKKGGILVMLREIELIAESYPDIAEAAAVKTEHHFYGESCVLYIRTSQPLTNPDPFISQMTAWLHAELVQHKWPDKIIYCDHFPHTVSGKIQKNILSQQVEHA